MSEIWRVEYRVCTDGVSSAPERWISEANALQFLRDNPSGRRGGAWLERRKITDWQPVEGKQ